MALYFLKYSGRLLEVQKASTNLIEIFFTNVSWVRMASRRHIPRGCRTEFIPGLTEESKSLYEAYKTQYSNSPFDDGTMESGNALLDSMIEEKKRRWEEVITSTNMTHNSRQAWKTIRMLSNDPTSSSPPCLVNANQVAHQLLVNGRGNMPSKPKRPVIPETEAGTSMVSPFSEDEYRKGVATLKNNKAASRDDVLVEQLKNLGPNAHKWLRAMLNNCFIDNKIPTIWRQSKIIAILKPGKDSAVPKSYRPISLLCHTYKLYERLILNRIAPTIEKHLIKEQAGFRAGKSCTSQLLNLTQHIKDGYQEGKITGTAFVDLSAAYDTVNHRLLIHKLYNTPQDSALCRVIQNLLSNRRFYVELNNERSRWRLQKNGLPKVVFSPLSFSTSTQTISPSMMEQGVSSTQTICVSQPSTRPSRKSKILLRRHCMSELTQYYRNNSLRANPDKTQVTAFHLRNREVKRSLNIAWNGVDLENTAYPKYLGVTLDRTRSQLQTAHTEHKDEGGNPQQPA